MIKNLSRIWVLTNRLFLIQNIHTDLKEPKIKHKLHYAIIQEEVFFDQI